MSAYSRSKHIPRSDLIKRIKATADKNELLFQFCEEGCIDGVQELIDNYRYKICTIQDGLRIWRLCEGREGAHALVLKILLKHRVNLFRIHMAS